MAIKNVKIIRSGKSGTLVGLSSEVLESIADMMHQQFGETSVYSVLSYTALTHKFPWRRLEDVPETYYEFVKNKLPKVDADQQKVVKDIVTYFTIASLLISFADQDSFPIQIYLLSSKNENDFNDQVNELKEKFSKLDATYKKSLLEVYEKIQKDSKTGGRQSTGYAVMQQIEESKPLSITPRIKPFLRIIDESVISWIMKYATIDINTLSKYIRGYIYNSIVNNRAYNSILNLLYQGEIPKQILSYGKRFTTIMLIVYIMTYKEQSGTMDGKKIRDFISKNRDSIYSAGEMMQLLTLRGA